MEDRDYRSFVEDVRAGTDLVALVSEYVPLKRAGRRHKGLCPFHDEKTPSFSVDGDRALFYCFGCNTGGDAFKFLMLREGVEFPEAVRLLGERLGLRPPESRGPGADRRRGVLAANRAAQEYFRARLTDAQSGRAARDYLAGRGVGQATIERFGIGFAPPGWEGLRDHLTATGTQVRAGVAAGLLVDKDNDGRRIYDRFRNRITFPIRSLSGDIVAFGGRTLDAEEPAKYLNSPESPVYVKGETLYGLDLARDAVRERAFAILVEGYLDLIGLVAAGFPNVVATLGTALTVAQARLLRRHTEQLVVCYDSDAAGRGAALRALEVLLGMGFRATVLQLPAGLDPDDFVRERGAEAYKLALGHSTPAIEFLADHFAEGLDLDDPRARAEGVNRVLPFLARLQSPIERAGHLETIARRFHVAEDLVLAELREALKRGRRSLPARGGPVPVSAPPSALKPAERKLLGILLGNPAARAEVLERLEPEDLKDTPIEPILRALREHEDDLEDLEPAALADRLPDDESRGLLTRALFEEDGPGSAEEARDCLRAIRLGRLTRERDRVQRELERARDGNVLNDLMCRKMELSRRIDALS